MTGCFAAGGSRLLYDYADKPRADILDILFKPKFGASLQILKVLVGFVCNLCQGRYLAVDTLLSIYLFILTCIEKTKL